MEYFKVIYAILATFEAALDGPLDKEKLSARYLNISDKRRVMLLLMLQDEGYIKGVKELKTPFVHEVNIDNANITIKGLDYLENNSNMKRAYRALKKATSFLK